MAAQVPWSTYPSADGSHVSFRLTGCGAEEPCDPIAWLDRLANQLEQLLGSATTDAAHLRAAAAPLYRFLLVEMSLLDDPAATPVEEDDSAVDLWSPAYLATLLQHRRALIAILNVHARHAEQLLRLFLAEKLTDVPVDEATSLAKTSAATGGDATPSSTSATPMALNLDALQKRCTEQAATTTTTTEEPLLDMQRCPDLGGAVVLLGRFDVPRSAHARLAGLSSPQKLVKMGGASAAGVGVEDDREEVLRRNTERTECETQFLFTPADDEQEWGVPQILSAMRPVMKGVAVELHRAPASSPPSVLMEVVKEWCGSAEPAQALLVDANELVALSQNDLVDAAALVEAFLGRLLPVFHGKRMPAWGWPRAAATTPRGRTAASGATQPWWLCCAPQDATRVATFALWLTLRESSDQPPGSARRRRATTMLNEHRLAQVSLLKLMELNCAPTMAIPSAHLFIISRLLSRETSLEDFVDAVGDGIYLSALPASSSSAAFPGVVTALLAAGVAAASCVAHHEVAALRVLSRKTETLLVEIPYALSSSLRTFLLGEPATHAERFRELWLSDTTLSTPKKFRTRAELLFFTVVELVLLAAEQHNRRSGGESSPAALDVLAGWVGAWHGFFQRLHEAAAAPPRRGSMSRGASSSRSDPAAGGGGGGTPRSAAPDEEPAVGQEDERGAHETQDLLKRLCEVLPLRLRDGAAPLPAVADRLMLDPLVGEDEPVASPADALARDFSRAHQAFAREGGGATNDLKLRFYGLYKQATIGDVNVSKPWIVDQVGRAKWEAWHRLHGMSMEEAQQQYVGAYKEFHSGAAPPG